MMESKTQIHCLLLACGNPLRSDDGVGCLLGQWANDRFGNVPGVRVLTCQQWTPELAAEIAASETVLFADCSVEVPPGTVKIERVTAAEDTAGLATHHLGAAELLALARELYGQSPRTALLLTVGAASTELGEGLSTAVRAALPEARHCLDEAIGLLLPSA